MSDHSPTHQNTLTAGALTPVGIAAAALAVLFIAVAQLIHPDLAPGWAPISDLALGKHGWVMTIAFLLWATAGALATAAAARLRLGRWSGIGVALVGLSALGPALAGLFPADRYDTPPGGETLTGTIHGVGAMLTDALPLGMLVLSVCLVRRTARGDAARTRVLLATAALWVAALWVGIAMGVHFSAPDARLGPDTPVGWPNRVHVGCCLLAYASLLSVPVSVRTEQAYAEEREASRTEVPRPTR